MWDILLTVLEVEMVVFSGGVVEGQLFIRRSTNKYVQHTSALLCSALLVVCHISYSKNKISHMRTYVKYSVECTLVDIICHEWISNLKSVLVKLSPFLEVGFLVCSRKIKRRWRWRWKVFLININSREVQIKGNRLSHLSLNLAGLSYCVRKWNILK